MYAGMLILAGVVALQDTRYAVVPSRRTTALWVSTLAALLGTLLLRSGVWGLTNDHRQKEFGTISNSFYEPRRQALAEGGAVLGGVLGGLWWGLVSWVELLYGMRRGSPNRGLLNLEVAVVVGIIAGAVVGAVLGRLTGALWEASHRRRRRGSRADH